jgi:hypothetical protein
LLGCRFWGLLQRLQRAFCLRNVGTLLSKGDDLLAEEPDPGLQMIHLVVLSLGRRAGRPAGTRQGSLQENVEDERRSGPGFARNTEARLPPYPTKAR